MKKFTNILLLTVLAIALCSCTGGKKNTRETEDTAEGVNIDGIYVTDMAYGMEYFNSEIEVKGTELKLWIEHFGEIVEEYEGTFTLKGGVIKLTAGNGEQEFLYSAEEQTIYNEDMETTWIIEDKFVPSKNGEQIPEVEEQTVASSEIEDGSEPDPIPESVQGTYTYSDDMMNATLTIGTNDYKLYATSSAAEPLEVEGAAVYAGFNLLLLEEGNSVTCPYDEAAKTIEYSGYIFAKE